MSRRILRSTSVAALTVAAFVGACSKGDKAADSAKVADSVAAAAAAAAPVVPAAPAAPVLTDVNIVWILDQANATDSAAGSIAATKATNAQVKTFARNMMRDHHALRKSGQDLAKKLNVTPEMPAGDASEASAQSWRDSLTAMAKGASFDLAYINHEVAYHQAVLQAAQAALAAAQNQELKDLIQKAAPNLQAHLEAAQKIQSSLAGAAAPAAAPMADTAKKP